MNKGPDKRSRVSARKAAMDLLARREHSRRELEQKLRRRFDAEEIDSALEALAEEGLQSDERFAFSFTRERMLRGYGPRRIEAELQQRGVGIVAIDGALAMVPEEEGRSWRAIAAAVEASKFGDEPPTDYAGKARRMRFLYRRGFAVDDIDPVGD
jgi:regulatory protein